MKQKKEEILKVSDLTVRFQDQTILDKVSFSLRKGSTLAIVGPNGAGKTVLFRTLLGLVPYDGKIEWAKGVKLGYVPQRLSVSDIPISVREFLSLKGPESAERALAAVGLDGKGLLDKRLGVLSGGQLQRVLIAWAIIDEPTVLLFDEPTAGVDFDSGEAIYRMLGNIKAKRGITIMLISHEVHIIREYSDTMLALNRCVTFFDKSQKIADLDVQKMVYGEPVCLEP